MIGSHMLSFRVSPLQRRRDIILGGSIKFSAPISSKRYLGISYVEKFAAQRLRLWRGRDSRLYRGLWKSIHLRRASPLYLQYSGPRILISGPDDALLCAK